LLAADFPGSIDLLITDIAMDDVDGLQLADRLLAERPTILYVSAYCDQDELGSRLESKRIGFLKKPFTVSRLLAHTDEILRECEGGG